MGVPEPTRPRRPIAAMHKGPGPCYQLRPVVGKEEHCLSHRVMPAYSMAGRGKQFTDDCSPGPKYEITKGLTNKGSDGTPHVGISGRHPDMTSFMTPSPAAYQVDHSPTKRKAPSYSMGQRTNIDDKNKNPDKYGVETAQKQVYRAAPQYSIGGRTKQSKSDNTPSPNAYQLPTCLGTNLVDKSSAPSYGVKSRPVVGGFSEDLQKTPGPGTYPTTDPNIYKSKRPAFTMTARNEVPGDTTTKPGPGAHRPENTPGPGAYKTTPPEVTKKRAPAYHLIGKYPVPFRSADQTPGPANYNNEVVVTKKQSPAFSFGIRHSEYTAPLIVEPTDCD